MSESEINNQSPSEPIEFSSFKNEVERSDEEIEKVMMTEYEKIKKDFVIVEGNYHRIKSIVEAYRLIEQASFKSYEDAQVAFTASLEEYFKLHEKKTNLEDKIQHFSIVVIYDSDKFVFLSRRNNEDKDFYDHYQFPGGRLISGETPRECATRELFEETGIAIKDKDLIFIEQDVYFSVFLASYVVCNIYGACIYNSIPKHLEMENNDPWVKYDYKDMTSLNLTRSLKKYLDKIILFVGKSRKGAKRRSRRSKNSSDYDSSDEKDEKNRVVEEIDGNEKKRFIEEVDGYEGNDNNASKKLKF